MDTVSLDPKIDTPALRFAYQRLHLRTHYLWISLTLLLLFGASATGFSLSWILWERSAWENDNQHPSFESTTRDSSKTRPHLEGCPSMQILAKEDASEFDPDDVESAIVYYMSNISHSNLVPSEILEFQQAFYIVLQEDESRIGALELRLDKDSGTIGPEYGPNMVWNTRYGLEWVRASSSATENVVSMEEALEIAQRWATFHRPGSEIGAMTPFYGYYNGIMLKNNTVQGILSINATTGQVWYHTWHSDFIRSISPRDYSRN